MPRGVDEAARPCVALLVGPEGVAVEMDDLPPTLAVDIPGHADGASPDLVAAYRRLEGEFVVGGRRVAAYALSHLEFKETA